MARTAERARRNDDKTWRRVRRFIVKTHSSCRGRVKRSVLFSKKQVCNNPACALLIKLWLPSIGAELWDQGSDGRVIGRVFINGIDVNLRMVEQGAAWAYDQYLTDQNIKKAETSAREAQQGLWALQADQIVPPWDWRRGKKGNAQTQDVQTEKPQASSSRFICGGKRYCREMSSCDEARFYLRNCGLSRLDGDGDGIPCEKMCR